MNPAKLQSLNNNSSSVEKTSKERLLDGVKPKILDYSGINFTNLNLYQINHGYVKENPPFIF